MIQGRLHSDVIHLGAADKLVTLNKTFFRLQFQYHIEPIYPTFIVIWEAVVVIDVLSGEYLSGIGFFDPCSVVLLGAYWKDGTRSVDPCVSYQVKPLVHDHNFVA